MNTKPLKYMPHAQAHVEMDDDGIALVSYQTPVASIVNDCLYILGLYSATTRRHIMAFVREYVNPEMDFQSVKYLANNPVALNIKTGEVVNV